MRQVAPKILACPSHHFSRNLRYVRPDMPVVERGNDVSGEVFLKPSVTNIVCSRAKVIPVKSPSIAQSTSESGTSK